jgi:hypothetical protein
MLIRATVELGSGDDFRYTAQSAATQILAALGGNPTRDTVQVTVTMAAFGTAGLDPPAPTTETEAAA